MAEPGFCKQFALDALKVVINNSGDEDITLGKYFDFLHFFLHTFQDATHLQHKTVYSPHQ